MGQCFSCNQGATPAEDHSGAKFVKLASLKLQDAGSKVAASGGETAPELASAKALIGEAKNMLDTFDEANRISQEDLQAVQLKLDEAKELVAKAGGSGDVEESINRAEEALSSAMNATKKNEMAKLSEDAANAASEGARRLEKTVSSNSAKGRNLTKITSDVADAEKVLGDVALNEVYGDGSDKETLKAATEQVNSALQALDEGIKNADGELAEELKEVKCNMEKAAKNLEKRTSFK